MAEAEALRCINDIERAIELGGPCDDHIASTQRMYFLLELLDEKQQALLRASFESMIKPYLISHDELTKQRAQKCAAYRPRPSISRDSQTLFSSENSLCSAGEESFNSATTHTVVEDHSLRVDITRPSPITLDGVILKPGDPTDYDIDQGVQHLLRTADLNSITKREIRRQLAEKFKVDVTSLRARNAAITYSIDRIMLSHL